MYWRGMRQKNLHFSFDKCELSLLQVTGHTGRDQNPLTNSSDRMGAQSHQSGMNLVYEICKSGLQVKQIPCTC